MQPPLLSHYRGLALRYACRIDMLSGPLRAAFVALELDASTRTWIDDAYMHPTPALRLAARTAARAVLGDYDANALLDTHDMRVLGREQWPLLLGARAGLRWLDIGAGDGRVSSEIAPNAAELVTTETSTRMAARLRERGFTCHAIDLVVDSLPDPRPFDVVSLLNVVDRTSKPFTLLERAVARLAPGGRLVVAVPLPLSPHVHVGSGTVDPDELLPIDRGSFEAAANTLLEFAFAPLGLDVTAFARVPYLSRGDARTPVYSLDDAVFVLRKRA